MTMKNGRRKFTGEEKMAVLRRHLIEKVPVSDVCDEVGIHPTLFYRWQKELFEHGAMAFAAPKGRARNGRSEDPAAKRIATLEKKLVDKDEVIAEIMESHVRLKKSLGET